MLVVEMVLCSTGYWKCRQFEKWILIDKAFYMVSKRVIHHNKPDLRSAARGNLLRRKSGEQLGGTEG